jgi:multiple sugar transport system ATP-binding protein
MAAITLTQARKTFASVTVLDGISMAIEDGEFFALLGPSGCGKTTTLRAIAGLESLDSGHIHLGERAVEGLPPSERDIAFVFQIYTLYPHLSAAQNISFPLRAVGTPEAEIQKRVADVAQMLRIGHLLNLKPSALSGGDMQRVTIARALVRNPLALLMDEPLGALDAKLREEMRAELHHQRQITTVLVTHDQVEAMSMANRIAVMNQGVVQQIGSPQHVYDHPANLFVAQFIGAPSMNILDACSHVQPSGHVGVRLGRVNGPSPGDNSAGLWLDMALGSLPPGGHPLKLGIRPEALRVQPAMAAGRLKGEIVQIEPMGLHDLLSIQIDAIEQAVRAKVNARQFRQIGQDVSIDFDLAQCHLFDTETGMALI